MFSMLGRVLHLSGIIKNYQKLSNSDQITTVMSDHNNLRAEIKILKRERKAEMNKYNGICLSLYQPQAN